MSLWLQKILGIRTSIWIPVQQFSGLNMTAPTVTIQGGEGGTVAIGIDSDANGAALSKTAATDRTGITGVQAPWWSITGETGWSSGAFPLAPGMDILSLACASTSSPGPRIILPVPFFWNLKKDIWFRILFSLANESYTTEQITWYIKYDQYPVSATFTPGVSPATALDTPIAAVTMPTGGFFEWTSWGVLKGNTLSVNTPMLHFCVGFAATGTLNDKYKHIWGVEIAYVPDYTKKL